MGTSIALKTAQKCDALDEPVVLLEKGALAAGSSGRSGAILRMHYADQVVAMMARDSLREFAGFEGRTGRSIGFRRTGILLLVGAEQADRMAQLEKNIEMLTSIGIRSSLVDEGEIRDLFPGLHVEEGTVGAWEPDGGFLEPVKTVEAFGALARSYGAVTRVGVGAERLVVEGGRITGAETTRGTIHAESVVVCAGAWSHRLLAEAGVELPLRAVRPENHFIDLPRTYHEAEQDGSARGEGSVDLEDPLEALSEQLSGQLDPESTRAHPVLIDLETGFYARCHPDDHKTRIGRTDYESDDVVDDPDALDEEVSSEMKAWAREQLCHRVAAYQREKDAGSEAALYTLTPDSQAIIGPAPGVQGLFVVSGFSGHGFKLAPAVGEGVAQMIFGEAVSAFDPDFFSPTRFASTDASAFESTGAFGL